MSAYTHGGHGLSKASALGAVSQADFYQPQGGSRTFRPMNSLATAGMSQVSPRISSNGTFSVLENQFKQWVNGNQQGRKDLWNAWNRIDYNGNGRVSLAEIDKWVVESYPLLNHKPALMRAYRASSAGQADGYIHKIEFPVLLRNIIYFNKLWKTFSGMDDDNDRRLTFSEFRNSLGLLELDKAGNNTANARATFDRLDVNKGGLILFDEFCKWVASVQCPVDSSVYDASAMAPPRRQGMPEMMQPSSSMTGRAQQQQQQLQQVQSSLMSSKFNQVESELQSVLHNKRQCQALWRRLDYNGNGIVSLAEIDKLVVECYPELDNKPALMRSYQAVIGKDSWVQKKEFRALIRALLYFNKVWAMYDVIDSNDDRRLDFREFQMGAAKVGISLSPTDARDEFDFMDTNNGGKILFDEFCKWVGERKCPLE